VRDDGKRAAAVNLLTEYMVGSIRHSENTG